MMYMKSLSVLGVIATTFLLTGCPEDLQQKELMLDIKGLESLGETAVYEGWLISNNKPVSTGRFTVDDKGVLSQTKFKVDPTIAKQSTAFVLTIEPKLNDKPEPTDLHLIAGDFDQQKIKANLNVEHKAAFGQNFTTASGSFILATPTSASTTDDNLGIWYLKVQNGTPTSSLSLPVLPKGWIYEGWVVVDGKPISTGRFNDVNKADSDGAGATKGELPAPPFVGQDFINPPLNLVGGTAVISVEPEEDNSPAPFLLKPLAGAIENKLGPANSQPLTNTTLDGKTLPQGSATFK